MRPCPIALCTLWLVACSGGESRRGERRDRAPVASAPATEARVAVPAPVPQVAAPAPAPVAVPASPSPAPAPAANASRLEVIDATFTHGVQRRTPIDRVSQFRVGERVTYLVVIKNQGPASDVTLEWVRDGRVMGRQSLAVGTSPGWRTWALRSVVARDLPSGIEVRVVDADGNVLHTDRASVTAAPATPAA